MNKTIYSTESLLSSFPYALTRDEDKVHMSAAIAGELVKLLAENRQAEIFTRIDELDEELLDRLAVDFKVDWYIYDATLQAKRAQIKSCFYIHKHLGTKRALSMALSDVFPMSEILEWFEYEGKPYHFALVLDVTKPQAPISQDIIERIVNAVKPVRCGYEGEGITYRIHNVILIGCKCGYAIFTSRLCGTYPYAAVQGDIEDFGVTIRADYGRSGFAAPRVKSLNGTYPSARIHGTITNDTVRVGENGENVAFAAPTVKSDTGTYPSARIHGDIGEDVVLVSAQTENGVYSAPANGTKPRYAVTGENPSESVTVLSEGNTAAYGAPANGTKPLAAVTGEIHEDGVTAAVDSDVAAFTSAANGTKPYDAASGEIAENGISAADTADNAVFAAPAVKNDTGAYPDARMQGDTSGGGIDFGTSGEAASVITRNCGTPFGNLI